jgi:hypothetical protein
MHKHIIMAQTLKELKQFCKENGIKGYTNKNKADIIKLIESAQSKPSTAPSRDSQAPKVPLVPLANTPSQAPSVPLKQPEMLELFRELANYNTETGETRLVNVCEFVNKYAKLKTNNGLGWLRQSGLFARTHRVITIKENGKTENYNCTEEDIQHYETHIKSHIIKNLNKGNKVKFIKVFGKFDSDATHAKPPRKDIREHYKNKSCVSCGKNKTEIDHKNGLYNNPRVNNQSTQTVDDFQPLCMHCNQEKRQAYIWQKNNNIRHPATLIPKYAHFGIDYVEGTGEFDSNNPDAMVGTYWYDPVEFHKKFVKIMQQNEIEKHNKRLLLIIQSANSKENALSEILKFINQ